MDKQIAIIDLGSNTTRMIIMAYTPRCCFKLVGETRETVRLAEGVGDDQMLQPRAMQRAIEALKMFSKLSSASGVDYVVAVGTSALREAANQGEFLHRLKRESGLDMRILSSEEEAYYGYLGVVNALPIEHGFMIDIGGGSTEIAEICDRTFHQYFSQQAGSVRFTERYINSDPISKKNLRALQEGAATAFAGVDWFKAAPGKMLAGVGGTIRALAGIDQKRRRHPIDRVHGYVLTRAALSAIINTLRVKNQVQREAIPGLNRDRADVILAGSIILHQLMIQSGFEEVFVSGQGLREGLFYEHFLSGQERPLFPTMREFSVLNLAHLYNSETHHSAKVRELSLALFDQLQLLHGYGTWERELLAYAAELHDIGKQINFYDHHKHSAYLVVNSGLQGFQHREIALLALLTRIHRKGGISNEFDAILREGDSERVMRLGSLLRIAEYLERGKSQVVQTLRVEPAADAIRVRVQAAGDATVELWDANRRTNLFEKAFGRKIEIVQ